jgi:hypothetical protein
MAAVGQRDSAPVTTSLLGASDRRSASLVDYAGYLVGVVALAWAITSVWLAMRAVMALGGYCASGGPYQIEVECPDGVSLVMLLAFPIGFLGAGLMVWKGVRLGGGYAGLVGLAWPALFLSLGFNFLQYGVSPPGGGGLEFGWLVPGVIFVLMGAFPLLGWLSLRDHTTILPGVSPRPTPRDYAELARALREAARVRASEQRVTPPPVGSSGRVEVAGAGAPRTLVEGLERLAVLHGAGSLNDDEYAEAKRALIAQASHGDLAS